MAFNNYPITEETQNLNQIILEENPAVYSMLTQRGLSIYFPKKGILSQSAEAKGKKINATIGVALEDNLSPMHLSAISNEIPNMNLNDIFLYSPSSGNPKLREQWKKLIIQKNPSLQNTQISLPIVTSALTHGLNLAGYLFAEEKKEIIIPDLYWENYNLVFENTYGAKLTPFPTFSGREFNLEGLSEIMSKNTNEQKNKILALNFPNNPTGYSPTKEEAEKITSILKKSADKNNSIVVLLDDAYFGFAYEENVEKESLFSKLADSHENILAVKLDAATKEDYAWGLRVGFMTFGIRGGNSNLYSALEAKAAGAARATNSSAPNLSQSLVSKALNSEYTAAEKNNNFNIMKERFEKVKDTLKNESFSKYFTPLPFNSGYFMCVKFNDDISAEKVRKILLEKYDTGIIAWEKGNLGRIAFSSVGKDQIGNLFNNIAKASEEATK